MLITTKTRYAIMALVHMASKQISKPLALKDIATNLKLDLSYLEQIFNILRKAEIVQSMKGPGGGYKLAHKPEEISLFNIADLFQDNLKLTACGNNKVNACNTKGLRCNSHGLWVYVGSQLRTMLSAISILDILEGRFNYDQVS